MNNLRILICDDEEIVVEQIKGFAADFNAKFKVDGVNSVMQMTELLEKKDIRYDVVFMDIVLENDNGIDLSVYLLKKLPEVKLIFITGYHDCAQEVFFSVRPYGYIKKPISQDMFNRYLLKVQSDIKQADKYFYFTARGKQYSVRFTDICYAESNREHIYLYTANERISFVSKLDEAEKQFPQRFIRCHKSYLVNPEFVRQMDTGSFLMFGEQRISISRSRLREAEEKYYKFKGGML